MLSLPFAYALFGYVSVQNCIASKNFHGITKLCTVKIQVLAAAIVSPYGHAEVRYVWALID